MRTPSVAVYRIELQLPDANKQLAVRTDEFIWDAAQMNGITLPAICHQGRCLTCAGRIAGVGSFDQSAAEAYLPEDRAAGFILLCTARPVGDLRIYTHQQDEMRRYRIQSGLPAPYA